MSYANVFAGGLFISMAFVHLLPEASLVLNYNQGVEKIQQLSTYDSKYDGNGKIVEIGKIKILLNFS